MNTLNNRTMRTFLFALLMLTGLALSAQSKSTIGLVNIDIKGLNVDNETFTSMVHLELEKTNVYEVMDKYDIGHALRKDSIDPRTCFGKNRLIEVGVQLEVDKMFTGSVEHFGDKIIMIFKVIDVQSKKVEKTNVMEYIDQMEELQTMIQISMNSLIGIENEQHKVDMLANYERPINTSKKSVNLNGPRTGLSYTSGTIGSRLMAPVEEGGLDMYNATMMLGYQFERQYISSGDFQALIEFIPAINGLESGKIIPSFTFLNGFRFNNTGWEVGLGPVIRFSREAQGYYDTEGEWHLASQAPVGSRLQTELDHRGNLTLHSGIIIAVGKTFRSGHLNIPVNMYVSPNKEGTTVGVSFGFNVLNKNTTK
jgi:hypothetical protein